MNTATMTQSIPLQKGANGTWHVSGTRVPVDTVIKSYLNGENAEEIAENFDTVRLADIYAILSYYLERPSEMTAYLQHRDQEATQIRQRIETQHPPHNIRQRLLARRRTQLEQQYA